MVNPCFGSPSDFFEGQPSVSVSKFIQIKCTKIRHRLIVLLIEFQLLPIHSTLIDYIIQLQPLV